MGKLIWANRNKTLPLPAGAFDLSLLSDKINEWKELFANKPGYTLMTAEQNI